MKYKIKKIFIIFLIIIFILLFILIKNKNEPFKIQKYTLKNISHIETETIFKYELKNNPKIKLYITKIEQIDKKNSFKLIENEINTIDAVYKNGISPYPDVISNKIICPKEYTPKKYNVKSKNKNFEVIKLYLDSRFNYGICINELIKYKEELTWIFCNNKKKLIKIKFITPINNSLNIEKEKILENNYCN